MDAERGPIDGLQQALASGGVGLQALAAAGPRAERTEVVPAAQRRLQAPATA